MLTAPMTSQPTRKPKWLAQAGTPLRSLFRAVTGRSALLMALATVTFAAVSFTPNASYADGASAPAASAPAADASAPAAAAASSAPSSAPAAAPAPTPNKGDMAWMMTSTALVLFMSVPALALFYGGLVREKNMLSVLMQVFVGFSLITVLWCVYGYSLAFTEGPNPFIGGLSRLFLNGTFNPADGSFSNAATFDKGVPLNELVYVGFQATFAAITCCLILGSLVERIKFSAALVFMVFWFTFAYLPVAHMVWFWEGPDAYTSASVADAMNAHAGYIWQMGALDFAGGTEHRGLALDDPFNAHPGQHGAGRGQIGVHEGQRR